MRPILLIFCAIFIGITITISEAQTDCGVVDGIGFPVDTSVFSLTQDFSVPSSRHEGRYHTGEDWYGGRDNSLGQAVRAAARGRVTYSSVNGWGRDGGVVILEHTFPDGNVYHTVYGHMGESAEHIFPTRLSCVQQGAVIGVVDDVRPAPHLHFEVRTSGGTNGTLAGAGYSDVTPYEQGFRNPSKFIVNQQTWLSLWHDWHLMVGSESRGDENAPIAPLVSLTDNSVLYLDGAGRTLRRATPDGRILWRTRLEIDAVAIEAWRGSSLLTLADGTMQVIDVETGGLGETWRVPASFTGAPLIDDDDLLFPAPDNSLVRVGADRREIIATYNDIPEFYRAHILLDASFAILTANNEFRYYSAEGFLLNSAQLRASASLATSWEGRLLVYSQGGLWRVDTSGTWSLYIEDAPSGGTSGSVLVTQERLYLYNGSRLFAYNRDRQLLWEAGTPAISGLSEIHAYDDILLITSNHGDIILVNSAGGFCNQVRIFGDDNAHQWQALGADNRLRLAIADQILALDWETFIRPCNV